jgi:hypothetical protein
MESKEQETYVFWAGSGARICRNKVLFTSTQSVVDNNRRPNRRLDSLYTSNQLGWDCLAELAGRSRPLYYRQDIDRFKIGSPDATQLARRK